MLYSISEQVIRAAAGLAISGVSVTDAVNIEGAHGLEVRLRATNNPTLATVKPLFGRSSLGLKDQSTGTFVTVTGDTLTGAAMNTADNGGAAANAFSPGTILSCTSGSPIITRNTGSWYDDGLETLAALTTGISGNFTGTLFVLAILDKNRITVGTSAGVAVNADSSGSGLNGLFTNIAGLTGLYLPKTPVFLPRYARLAITNNGSTALTMFEVVARVLRSAAI